MKTNRNRLTQSLLAVMIVPAFSVCAYAEVSSTMLYPKDVVDVNKAFVAVVKVTDINREIDFTNIRATLDGNDISDTLKAMRPLINISLKNGITGGSHRLVLTYLASDGRTIESQFTLKGKVVQPSVVKLEGHAYTVKGTDTSSVNNNVPVSLDNVDVGAKLYLGPLSGYFNVKNDSLTKWDKNNFDLKYGAEFNTKLLKLKAFDLVTDFSPLTLTDFPVKGYEIDANLFVPGVKAVYGSSESTYERSVVAVKPYLKLGNLLQTSLTALQVKDKDDPVVRAANPDITPGLNYVFAGQASSALWKLSASAEVAASILFDNATGNFDADLVKDSISDPNVIKLLEENLPAIDLNNIPYMDLGGQLNLNVPLLIANLEGQAFYYGPRFKLMGATVDQNLEGYAATLRSNRFFDAFSLEAGYENKSDNVTSLVSDTINKYISLDDTEDHGDEVSDEVSVTQERANYVSTNAKFFLDPMSWPALSLSVEQTKKYDQIGNFITGKKVIDSTTDDFNASLDNINFKLLGLEVETSVDVGLMKYRSQADSTTDYDIRSGGGAVKLRFGNTTLSMAGGLKLQDVLVDDTTDTTTPTGSLGIEQRFGNLRVSLKGSASEATRDAAPDSPINTRVRSSARADYRLSKTQRLTTEFVHINYDDKLDASNSKSGNTWYLRYNLTF